MEIGDGFLTRFVVAVLATWRVTHLLASEDGPGDIIFRLRRRFGEGPIASLMDCFNCMSLWVAAPAAFFVSLRPLPGVFSWLALSGGACLLERLAGNSAPESPVQPREGDDDVLRQ